MLPVLGPTSHPTDCGHRIQKKGSRHSQLPLGSGPSGGGAPCHNGLGKLAEIIQVATADLIDNIPIDALVAMHREVPESHSLLHAVCQGRTDDLQPIEGIEVLGHRRGRRHVSVPDEMGGHIDGKLNGPAGD